MNVSKKWKTSCKVGDEIMVKATAIDKQGRLNLSRKDAMPNERKENPTIL